MLYHSIGNIHGRKNRKAELSADALVNKNGNIFHLMLSTLVINLLALAMPIMMLQTYDRILPSHGIGTLILLISGVAAAVTLKVGLRLTQSYLTGWSRAVFEHKTACAAMSHLLNANVQAFEEQGAGLHSKDGSHQQMTKLLLRPGTDDHGRSALRTHFFF